MNTAERAQRLRKELLTWPDVSVVHGPGLHSRNHYFLRAVFNDHTALALEITGEDDKADE